MATVSDEHHDTTLSALELRARIERHERMQLVDVRSPGEYAAGHIPGALNLPMEEAEARIEDLSKIGEVVLVCQSGSRASMTCEQLSDRMPDLKVLDGGTDAWIASGYDVVRSTATTWSLERQVRLTVGVLILASSTLALTVNSSWAYATMFFGAGLTFAGLTNWCGMGMLISKMPWNRP
jgi:rhodanese-related sulfurtransferase